MLANCKTKLPCLKPSSIAYILTRWRASYVPPLHDLFYNDEQKEMQSRLRNIIKTDINPFVDEWEAAEEFPSHQIFKKLGAAGLLGVQKPKENGGLGLSYKHQASILEELGLIACGGVPLAIAVQIDMATTALTKFGSDQLKRDYLEPAITGDAVFSFAVSESEAGSDVAAIKTFAVSDGDDLVINGQKKWVMNGIKADFIVLLANTSKGKTHRNKSLIVVPSVAKGISRTKMRKLGLRSCDTALIEFNNVRVPRSNIIGVEGQGFMYQMDQFEELRLSGSLFVIKSAEQVLKATIEHASQRQAFGRHLLNNEWVQFRLVELIAEVEALRALTHRAVDLRSEGINVAGIASMVKVKSGVLARRVADTCLEIWGERGYNENSYISRFCCDARYVSLGGGSDEINMEIICKITGICGN